MGDEEKGKKEFSEFDETVLQSEDGLGGGASEAPGPYLIVVQGPRQGLKFPLSPGDNAIGRTMGADVLLEDQSVSRRHALVTQTKEGWTVEDGGSKNGTFVNGEKISEKVTIGHGDIIQAGIYSLRLITKRVSEEEEMKLPAEWEGKTVISEAKAGEETATNVEATGEVPAADAAAGGKALSEGAQGTGSADETSSRIQIPQEISEEKKKLPRWLLLIVIGVVSFVVIGGVAAAYFAFFYEPGGEIAAPPAKAGKLKKPKTVVPSPWTVPGSTELPRASAWPPIVTMKPVPQGVQQPAQIPVFLDFASSPLPAKVSFEGKDYGVTPVKIQATLDVDKEYFAEAEFDLSDVNEKMKEKVSFRVKRDESLIPVLFKGAIGVIKVMELPRDVDLYLEGYFLYDPFNARPAKLGNVVFGKPVYLPYGKYVIELRKAKEVVGSGEFVKDIRYRREIIITEDNPVFELKIAEKDLNEFPIEITSVPLNADVFIDGSKVGSTPYQGIFPLGEHTLILRKDGYFEAKDDFKMDMNVPVKKEVVLRTTLAGEGINAGKLLMQKGQYKEAIEKLTGVFKQTPTPGETAQARYLVGSCFVHLNDLVTAEGYFKQALEDPGMKHAAMLGLVSVYQGLGRTAEAIPNLVDVLLNATDETVKKEAQTLFQQVSPLKSIMYVRTTPEGAKVYLNDQLQKDVTPLIAPDLSFGNYKVKIEKNGYVPQELNINMAVSEFKPVIVNLQKVAE